MQYERMIPKSTPPELERWHDRIARLRDRSDDVGHLLIEAVYCYAHGDEPVWEVEWTIQLANQGEADEYLNDIRLDWEAALNELSAGRCSWAGPTLDLEWLEPVEGRRLRYKLFD